MQAVTTFRATLDGKAHEGLFVLSQQLLGRDSFARLAGYGLAALCPTAHAVGYVLPRASRAHPNWQLTNGN